MKERKKIGQGTKNLIFIGILVLFAGMALLFFLSRNYDGSSDEKGVSDSEYIAIPDERDPNRIENGVHVRTGLVEADGLMEVVNNCTTCHSAKLVTQNRMNKERWIATIRWMQETQNLWDLGENEEIIVNYLVTNYPPTKKGRREILKNVEWYDLKD